MKGKFFSDDFIILRLCEKAAATRVSSFLKLISKGGIAKGVTCKIAEVTFGGGVNGNFQMNNVLDELKSKIKKIEE